MPPPQPLHSPNPYPCCTKEKHTFFRFPIYHIHTATTTLPSPTPNTNIHPLSFLQPFSQMLCPTHEKCNGRPAWVTSMILHDTQEKATSRQEPTSKTHVVHNIGSKIVYRSDKNSQGPWKRGNIVGHGKAPESYRVFENAKSKDHAEPIPLNRLMSWVSYMASLQVTPLGTAEPSKQVSIYPPHHHALR